MYSTLGGAGGKFSLEEGMRSYSSILAWRIPMDRGAWKATVHWVTKSQMQLKRLSTHTPKYELLGAKVLCYLQISIWTAPAGFRGKHVMSPALKGLGVKSQLQH